MDVKSACRTYDCAELYSRVTGNTEVIHVACSFGSDLVTMSELPTNQNFG